MGGSSTCTATLTPDHVVLSVPGVGKILAGQVRGRLGDPRRFTSLAAARSFSGLIPHQSSSGLTDAAGGPTKQGDACLREALFLAADHARKTDPTLAARYQRLMCQTGRHHTSALCTVATVLLTRIVACLRNGTPTSSAMSMATRSPRARPSDRRRALPSPTRDPCRPSRGQQRPQPPPQLGRAHRARSRQALHDDARPTTSLTPARSLDNHEELNGPPLTANALGGWCRFTGAGTSYIEPGSPWQNPQVESFGGRLRDELLAVEAFNTLLEAQVLVEDWRIQYDTRRPHSALGYLTRPTTPRPGPPTNPHSHNAWTNNRGPVRPPGPLV
jgi:transposase InsO family protein